jgi:hypothetical protein
VSSGLKEGGFIVTDEMERPTVPYIIVRDEYKKLYAVEQF